MCIRDRYCDGSLIDGKWSAIRCSGFGIAAVSIDGDLLAYGHDVQRPRDGMKRYK